MIDYICKKIVMKELIESAWEDRSLLENDTTKNAICQTIDLLDRGQIRIANKNNGVWSVNDWVKKAVILYFPIMKMKSNSLVK